MSVKPSTRILGNLRYPRKVDKVFKHLLMLTESYVRGDVNSNKKGTPNHSEKLIIDHSAKRDALLVGVS